jgi:hypothetical protein
VLCKYCGRKFNENAGPRHIAFCETKYKKDQMKTGGKAAAPVASNTKQRTTSNNFGRK